MKKKVSLPAGRLKELLDERNLSRKALTENALGGPIIDTKTVKVIERGEEVKIETMEKICEPLGLSLDELLAFNGAPLNLNSRVVEFDLFGESIPAYEARADEISGVLRQAARIRKNIDLQTLSTKQENLILALEDWIKTSANAVPQTTDQSFSQQIEFKRISKIFEQIQQQLRSHNLKVLIAKYKFWERSDQFYNHHDIYFTSTNIVARAIVPTSATGTTFSVIQGEKPPKTMFEFKEATESWVENPDYIRVWVNGALL